MIEKDLLDFLDSVMEEAGAEALEEKKKEITSILLSNEASRVARAANVKLTKSGLDGVTSNPAEILNTMKSDDKKITLELSDEDDRLLRYDELYGSGVFKDLGIKRNLDADS
tara:strand:+ start:8128 stop:8463 length:336 start_codon:yes stop_codon:yes gene_type:complete